MKCAFCNATLAADATQCPACGTWQKKDGEDGPNPSDLDHQDEIETTSKMFSSLMPSSSYQTQDNEYPFSSLQIAATLERDEPVFSIPFEMAVADPANPANQEYSQPSFTTDFDSPYEGNAEEQANSAFQDLSRLSPTITPPPNLGFPNFTLDLFDGESTLAAQEAAQITGAFPMELLYENSESSEQEFFSSSDESGIPTGFASSGESTTASTGFSSLDTPGIPTGEKAVSENIEQADASTPMLMSHAQEEMASWETAFSMPDGESTSGASLPTMPAEDQPAQETDINQAAFPAAENIEQSNFIEYFSMPAPQQLPDEEPVTVRTRDNISATILNNTQPLSEKNAAKTAETIAENKAPLQAETTIHQYNGIEDSVFATRQFNLKTWLTSRKRFLIGLIIPGIILVALPLLSPDWAQGALIGAILALLIICGLLLLTRRHWLTSHPRKPITQYTGRSALIAILLLYSGVGIFGQTALHLAQGHSLEGQQQWSSAIKEYELGGESSNNSEDIARTGIEWAETLAQQQDQSNALTQLDQVSNAASAYPELKTRLQKDKVQTLLTLGNTASKQHSYAQATSKYDSILASPACDATCRKQVSTADASAYYNLGESYLKQKNYSKAVTYFQAVVTKFPSSSEVKQEHTAMAKALIGQGKTEIANASTCSNALSNYQKLSTHYSDTPEGQEAKSTLQNPQIITGHFSGTTATVTGYEPVAVLVQNVTSDMSSYEITQLAYTNPYTPIDTNGNFSFTAQPQGTYGLIWGAFDASGIFHLATPSYDTQGNLAYNADVQALCPFNFGTINATFTLEN